MRHLRPTAPVVRHALVLALTLTLATAPGLVRAPAATAADPTGPSWSVAPAPATDGTVRPNFDYRLDPGAVVSDAFAVRNDGGTPLTLDVYAADAFTTREGGIDLLPAGTTSVDSGTWISLASRQVTVQPGDETTIPFTLTVPGNARPGDHPTGIVTSLRTADASATVQLDRRLGSRMMVRVAGSLAPSVSVSRPTLDFSGVWSLLATGTLLVSYEIRNTGNTRMTATSAVTVHGPLGIGAVSAPPAQLPEVLPGSTIDVRQEVAGAGALFWLGGRVTVAPESAGIDGRALDPVDLDLSVPAVPAALLLLLVLLAAVAVAVLLLRRRRRRLASTPVTPVDDGAGS